MKHLLASISLRIRRSGSCLGFTSAGLLVLAVTLAVAQGCGAVPAQTGLEAPDDDTILPATVTDDGEAGGGGSSDDSVSALDQITPELRAACLDHPSQQLATENDIATWITMAEATYEGGMDKLTALAIRFSACEVGCGCNGVCITFGEQDCQTACFNCHTAIVDMVWD